MQRARTIHATRFSSSSNSNQISRTYPAIRVLSHKVSTSQVHSPMMEDYATLMSIPKMQVPKNQFNEDLGNNFETQRLKNDNFIGHWA